MIVFYHSFTRNESTNQHSNTNTQVQKLHGATQGTNTTKRKIKFEPGDRVVCVEGELRNVQGVVVSVNVSSVRDDIVVKMDHEALEENLTFTSNMLKKHINIGEHVKIVSGTHVGETGMVVHTETAGDREGVAVVINDNGGKELRVFVSDLHPTTEISRGHDTLEGYNLHDLVQLPSNEVGVIVRWIRARSARISIA